MAENPDMLKMQADMLKGMSDEQLKSMAQAGGAPAGFDPAMAKMAAEAMSSMGPEELKSMMDMAQQMQGAGGDGGPGRGRPRRGVEQPGDDAEDAGPRDDGEGHGHAQEHGPRYACGDEREDGHEADQRAGRADAEHEAGAHAVPREAHDLPAVRLLTLRRGSRLRPSTQKRPGRPRHSYSSIRPAVAGVPCLIINIVLYCGVTAP